MSKLNISDEERLHILEMHHNQVKKDVFERSGFNEQNTSYITDPDDLEYIRRDAEYKKQHPEAQKSATGTWPPQDPAKQSPFPLPKSNAPKGPGPGNQPGITPNWPPQSPTAPSSPFPLPKNQGPPSPPPIKSGTGVNKTNSSVYNPDDPGDQTNGTGNNVKPVTPVPPVTSKLNMPGSGSDMVKQIQDKLNGLGLNVVSDGKLGKATLQAVLSALSRLGSSGHVEPTSSKPMNKLNMTSQSPKMPSDMV